MSDIIQAVWDAVDRDRDYVVELTRDLVRIPSVNPKFVAREDLNREPDVQDLLQARLAEEGFATDRWDVFPGRPNLIGDRPGSEEKSLILCGHIDVVPVADPEDWRFAPFSGEIAEGHVWGRGAVDMKGGVAACVAAARALRLAGVTLEGRLSIHSVVDEEAGGFGAIDAVKKGRTAAHCIVAEPTWGNVIPAEGGLTWVRVTLHGKQSHAGFRFNMLWPQPLAPGRLEPGVNAIELANRFLSALRDFEAARCRDNWHPLMPPGLATINPGTILGGAGLRADGTPELVTNPAIMPDTVAIDLDYKFMPDERFEDVKAEFEAFVHHFAQADPWMRAHPPSILWDLHDLHFPPMNTPVDHPLVASVMTHATALQPRLPAVKGFEAVTDAAHYAGAGVTSVIYGATGDGFHGTNERIEIESLVTSVKVLAASAIDMCGVT